MHELMDECAQNEFAAENAAKGSIVKQWMHVRRGACAWVGFQDSRAGTGASRLGYMKGWCLGVPCKDLGAPGWSSRHSG